MAYNGRECDMGHCGLSRVPTMSPLHRAFPQSLWLQRDTKQILRPAKKISWTFVNFSTYLILAL